MTGRRPRREPRPLDNASLEELALRYVARFATTQAKLRSYLSRKLRERGWSGEGAPQVDSLIERCTVNGFVDDRAYALAKSRSLVGRGYGPNRLRQALHAAGVAEDDGEEACEHARTEAAVAALRFARRRRLGPYGDSQPQRADRERAIAALVRAGHSFELALAIAALPPGAEVSPDELR